MPHVHVSKPTSPLFTTTTYHAPMIHAFFFFPYIHSFMFHICMFFPSSLWLKWLADPALTTLVYPNQKQYTPHVLQGASLLDGVNAGVRRNSRRFSKTSSYPPCHHYASILFYPYFLTISLSPLFLLIHLLPRPTLPPPYLTNQSHTLYCLCSSIVSLILLDLETSSNYGRTM